VIAYRATAAPGPPAAPAPHEPVSSVTTPAAPGLCLRARPGCEAPCGRSRSRRRPAPAARAWRRRPRL